MSRRSRIAVFLGTVVVGLAFSMFIASYGSDVQEATASDNPPIVDHGPEVTLWPTTKTLPVGVAGGAWAGTGGFWASDDLTPASQLTYTIAVNNLTNITGSAPTVTSSTYVQSGARFVKVGVEFLPGQIYVDSSFDIQVTFNDGIHNSTATMQVDSN